MSQETVDLHLTLLATWLVRTVGSALMWSLLVPFVLAVGAVVSGSVELLWLSLVVGPFVFAALLSRARAPLPRDRRS